MRVAICVWAGSGVSGYRQLLSIPEVWLLAAAKILARLPDTAFTLAGLFLVRSHTQSYTLAGATLAASAASWIVAARWLAASVERRHGASRVRHLLVLTLGLVCAVSCFVVIAALDLPGWLFVPAACLFGATYPPVGALTRTRLSELAGRRHAAAAHGWENITTETVFIAGPMVASAAIAAELAHELFLCFGVLVLAGVCLYVAAERRLPATSQVPQQPASSDRCGSSWLQRNVWPVYCAGALWLACYDAAVVGLAALAEQRNASALAGVWVAAMSVGGIGGALVYGSLRKTTRLRRPAAIGLAAYGIIALLPLLGSLWLAAAALVVGAVGAVPYMLFYLWLDAEAPPHQRAETYQALTAAMMVGTFVATAGAGILADHVGLAGPFLLAATAALAGSVIAAIWAPQRA